MRLTLAVLLLSAAVLSASAADPYAQNRRLGRGVNIIGYDPLWKSMDQARFQAKHFRLLKEAGFDAVRINLHPLRHMDRENGWALSTNWFATLDWAVSNATAAGLVAVLDFHEFHALGDDPEKHKPAFLSFWRQLAGHCRAAPDSVLLELLNEPNKKMTPALWNQYLREALAIIRAADPDRTVIVGPAFWNAIDHLDELDLPADDRHLIVTVHYYKPMDFTHQGASWSGAKNKSGIPWPGPAGGEEQVKIDLEKAAAWGRAHDRPLYLGEFGAYDKAPMESRVRYAAYVARTAESLGISWAWWQFDSDFLLYDIPRDAFVEPILRALVPTVR